MKVGDKVYCKDVHGEFIGWIASIDNRLIYPYSVVRDRKDIGLTRMELNNLYKYDGEFNIFGLESLTSIQDLIKK